MGTLLAKRTLYRPSYCARFLLICHSPRNNLPHMSSAEKDLLILHLISKSLMCSSSHAICTNKNCLADNLISVRMAANRVYCVFMH